MTNAKAVDRLFFWWLGASVVLLLFVLIQAAMGKYGTDWSIPAQWVVALGAPTIALLAAASANKGKGAWKDRPVDAGSYRLAKALTAVVWVGGFGVFVFETASSSYRIYDLLPIAGVGLLFVQSFAIGAISNIVFSNR